MACDNVKYLNPRQLRVLGLSFAILEAWPDFTISVAALPDEVDAAYPRFKEEVANMIGPFDDIATLDVLDFMHFEELGLAKLSSWFAQAGMHFNEDVTSSPIQIVQQRDFYSKMMETLENPETRRCAVLGRVNELMEGKRGTGNYGLKAVRLTPVGFLIGYCMYCISRGIPFVLGDDWNR
jgi:hypothetical protein